MRRSGMPTSVLVSVVVGLAALAPACSSSGNGSLEAPAASVSSPVVYGTDSDASQDAVVQILQTVGQDQYTCSGVLIAPNVVLTARHCVSEMADNPNGINCSQDGNTNTGDVFTTDSAAADLAVIPGASPTNADFANAVVAKKIFHADDSSICRFDIAILLLKSAIPNAKIAPIRIDAPPVVGESLTVVGWGVTDKTDQPTTRQQRKGITIRRVGPAAETTTESPLPPNFFEVGESICEGDSGGPGLSTATGAVVGLVSIGGNDYNGNVVAKGCEGAATRNSYFELSKAKSLILQALGEAGANPWIEGTSGPAPYGTGTTTGGGSTTGGTSTADAGATSGGSTADGGSSGTTAGDTPTGTTVTAKTGCSAAPSAPARSPFASLSGLALVGLALVRRRRARV